MIDIKFLWLIFKKDLTEIIRNRRAFISGFLLPALFIPLLIFFQEGFFGIEKKEKPNLLIYDYTATSEQQKVIERINQDKRFITKIVVPKSTEKDNESNRYDVTIIFQNFDQKKETINIFYSSNLPDSDKLYKWLLEYLVNIYPDNIKVDNTNLSEENRSSSLNRNSESNALLLYPWMFILLGFAGAAFVSTEIFSGEKERHTLENLLTPLENRSKVLISKYLTVFFFSMVNLSCNIIFLILSKQFIGMGISSEEFKQIIQIYFLSLPILFVLSGILLTISIRSKTTHESKSMESIFFLLLSVTVIAFSYMDIDFQQYMSIIPFINITLLIRSISMQNFNVFNLCLYLLSCFGISLYLFRWNNRYIYTESVINTESQGFSLKRAQNTNSYFFIVVLLIYGLLNTIGQKWVNDQYNLGVLKSQLILFGLPGLVFYYLTDKEWMKTRLSKGIKLKWVVLVSVVSILLVFPLNFIQYQIYRIFFPHVLQFSHIDIEEAGNTIWQNILFLSIIPGICEEMFFRGYLLSVLKRLKVKQAIIFSALLFALFHQNYPDYAVLFSLGLWFGIIFYMTGSLYYSMMAHIINNSMVFVLSKYKFMENRDLNLRNTAIQFVIIIIIALILKQMRAIHIRERVS